MVLDVNGTLISLQKCSAVENWKYIATASINLNMPKVASNPNPHIKNFQYERLKSVLRKQCKLNMFPVLSLKFGRKSSISRKHTSISRMQKNWFKLLYLLRMCNNCERLQKSSFSLYLNIPPRCIFQNKCNNDGKTIILYFQSISFGKLILILIET